MNTLSQPNTAPNSQTANVRVVIASDELGVYLGSALGLGFWSKLDDAGQYCAITFPDKETAKASIAKWHHTPADLHYIPITADLGDYASAHACERAGLHNWTK